MHRKLLMVSGGALEFEEGLHSPVEQVEQIGVESGDKYGSFNTIAL